MYVSLQDVDQTQFNVSEREGLFLITPRKDKHVWEDHELWYRSLLCDAEGNVISYGFPKFMNYHERPEHHDKAIREARSITVAEKLDGSLIIVSRHEDRGIIRTRGNDTLGEFEDGVMQALECCSRVREGIQGHSLLLEYCAPSNQIVVPYTVTEVYLLGVVIHSEIPGLITEPTALHEFASLFNLNVRIAGERDQPVAHILQEVPTWEDEEGVVVSCHFNDGRNPELFKVKSHWYLMMHALRYQMTAKKMRQLLVIEGLENFEAFRQYLYDFGYDFEIAEILHEAADEFFAAVDESRRVCRILSKWCREHESLARGEFVKQFTVDWALSEPWHFHYCMASYDKKNDTLFYPYAQACGESVRTIKTWLDTPDLVKTLLKTPATFEEEEDGYKT